MRFSCDDWFEWTRLVEVGRPCEEISMSENLLTDLATALFVASFLEMFMFVKLATVPV